MDFSRRVYDLCRRIPKGKVTTYKIIAEKLGTKAYRAVGNALNKNPHKDVPCHRVVDRNGRLAPNFGFGGAIEQKRRLESENVTFIDDSHVDLKACLDL